MEFKLPKLYKVNKNGSFQVWEGWSDDQAFHVSYGKDGGKMQTRTTFVEPKNVGKVNETSKKEQAKLELNSAFAKQWDKGYRYSKEEALEARNILPMLAHDYLKKSHKINYPCYVSRKLDGVRCFAKATDTTVLLTSRMGKRYLTPYKICVELMCLREETGIEKFDGELYIHGVLLQDIVGAAKKQKTLTDQLEYHIFDVPVGERGFESRLKDLDKIGKAIKKLDLKHIKLVTNTLVESEEEARHVMNDYLDEGYEGLMLRNRYGKYEFGDRSNDLQKWKDFKDMEVEIVSVREDKNGEGVYYCKMVCGKNVECKMIGSFETRNYETCKKNIGKWITLKYQALTKDGIPQFPVGIAFRDCDKNGNPLV